MTGTVNIYDAKTNLSKLVDRAAAGEEIVIAKAGKPKAGLVPYQPPRKKRRLGQNLLGITYIADDFDAPLSAERRHLARIVGAHAYPSSVGSEVSRRSFCRPTISLVTSTSLTPS
jgi:prevent-host-death family protein